MHYYTCTIKHVPHAPIKTTLDFFVTHITFTALNILGLFN